MGGFVWYKAFRRQTVAGGFGKFCLDERERFSVRVIRKLQGSISLEQEVLLVPDVSVHQNTGSFAALKKVIWQI